MEALWASPEPLPATELQDALTRDAAGTRLATTTVLTVLKRLEDKSFVSRSRTVRPHLYRAVRPRAAFVAELMHDVLGTALDREAVLARFVRGASDDDTDALRRMLGAPEHVTE